MRKEIHTMTHKASKVVDSAETANHLDGAYKYCMNMAHVFEKDYVDEAKVAIAEIDDFLQVYNDLLDRIDSKRRNINQFK